MSGSCCERKHVADRSVLKHAGYTFVVGVVGSYFFNLLRTGFMNPYLFVCSKVFKLFFKVYVGTVISYLMNTHQLYQRVNMVKDSFFSHVFLILIGLLLFKQFFICCKIAQFFGLEHEHEVTVDRLDVVLMIISTLLYLSKTILIEPFYKVENVGKASLKAKADYDIHAVKLKLAEVVSVLCIVLSRLDHKFALYSVLLVLQIYMCVDRKSVLRVIQYARPGTRSPEQTELMKYYLYDASVVFLNFLKTSIFMVVCYNSRNSMVLITKMLYYVQHEEVLELVSIGYNYARELRTSDRSVITDLRSINYYHSVQSIVLHLLEHAIPIIFFQSVESHIVYYLINFNLYFLKYILKQT